MSTRPSAGRSYAGLGPDERRSARRGALVEAGLDVLAEQGLTGIGVRAVCARAGLTARYFYESFPGLDELLVALCEQVGEEIATAGLVGLRDADDDLAARVRGCITGGFDVVLDDPRKACVVAVGAGHAGMNESRQRMLLAYADLVIEQFEQIAPEQQGQLSRPVAIFLVGGAVELVTSRITGQIEITRDDLIDQVADVFLAVMGVGR